MKAALLVLVLLVSPAPHLHPLQIGDSLSVGMTPYLSGFRVDAVVGRQFSTGIAVADWYRTHDLLPATVVLELGTNGPVTKSELSAMLWELRSCWRVLIVLPYGPRWWIPGVDRMLLTAHRRHLRWDLIAPQHPSWLGPDGIHLTSWGYQQLAGLIERSIR